jgi:hypothetical protein
MLAGLYDPSRGDAPVARDVIDQPSNRTHAIEIGTEIPFAGRGSFRWPLCIYFPMRPNGQLVRTLPAPLIRYHPHLTRNQRKKGCVDTWAYGLAESPK